MLDDDAVLLAIGPNALEPALHARKQADPGAVILQIPAREQHLAGRFFLHQQHIGKILIHIVAAGQHIGFPPELPHIVMNRLYVALCLHIIGRQGLVEIIANGQDRPVLLMLSCVFSDRHG